MWNISIEMKGDSYLVYHKLLTTELVDYDELDFIRGLSQEKFLPLAISNEGGAIIQCEVKCRELLKNYVKQNITKDCFLKIILQVINFLNTCEIKGLTKHNVSLDFEYIFVDKELEELSFIYWPLENIGMKNNIKTFFYEIVFQSIFEASEDNSYVKEYLSYFRKKIPFSLFDFKKFIEEFIQEKSTTYDTTIENDENNGETSVLDVSYWNGKKAQLNAGVAQVGFEQFDGGRIEPQYNGQRIEPKYGETTVLDPSFWQPKIGQGKLQQQVEIEKNPYLIRTKSGERIEIKKSNFGIGKDSESVDYVIPSNGAISRRHADIIIKGSHFFICDNSSTNKTYVDGREISEGKPEEIFSGMKLKLANEEFTFYV